MNSIKAILSIFLIHFCLLGSSNSEQYVILVSFDGFRYDYADRVDTPSFDFLEKNGIKAKSLKPVFPSFTFPNHYSIATGCYADKHGIIGNEFINNIGEYSYRDKNTVRDRKWYGAEPIWVTAEKNNIISATYFWVGSEAKIGSFYPTYYKHYESGIDSYLKVNQVIDWLNLPIGDRPRLICLYFNEPDHAGHVYGANSIEVNHQISKSDEILGYLIESLEKLNISDKINLVVVSDHGMVDVSYKKVINIDDYNLPGIVYGKGPIVNLMKTESINVIDNFKIPNATIVKGQNNKELNFNNDLYDFLVIADEGWMIYSNNDLKKYNGKLPVKGMHGYNSDSLNMHAIFYAYGPLFKKNMKIDTFELIHIYPLLCSMLDIKPYIDIDGDINVLSKTLK